MDNKNSKIPIKRRTSESMDNYGKIPPQAREIEKVVLGALLIDNMAIHNVFSLINRESFYEERHGDIFEAISTLMQLGTNIDMLTVVDQLKKNDKIESVGGAFYISELTNLVSSSANIEYHARIIAQKAMQRKIIEFSSQAIDQCYMDSCDVFDTINQITDALIEINGQLLQDSKETWQEATEKYVIEVMDKVTKGITETGTRVGLTELDQTIAGFRAGLYIIGGRPSMGKTSLAIELSSRFAELKKGKVGFFSLEMDKTQLINRVVARYTNIDQMRLINANLHKEEVQNLIEGGATASKLDFLINDKSTISINQIKAKAKSWAIKHKLSAIFVDYVQLVHGTNKQRHLEIGEISKGLKSLSKDLDIPIFALAQLGREKDAGKSMPKLSELRESGDLEQDADNVMLLYRPEYYGIEHDAYGKSTKGLTLIIVAKNRNGAINLKGAKVKSNLSINRYEDWENWEPKSFKEKIDVNPKIDDLPF